MKLLINLILYYLNFRINYNLIQLYYYYFCIEIIIMRKNCSCSSVEKPVTNNQHKSNCCCSILKLLNKKTYSVCVSMVGFPLFMSTVSPVILSGSADPLQMHFAVHVTVRAHAAAALMLNTQFPLSLSLFLTHKHTHTHPSTHRCVRMIFSFKKKTLK